MNKIESIWDKIEEELSSASPPLPSGAVSTRVATSESGQRLRVGVEWPTLARMLIFSADSSALPSRASWPECQGLKLILDQQPKGQATLTMKLDDARGKDVFTALAEDLARRAVGGSEKEAAHRVLAALARWQRFLAAIGKSLSSEIRRGLWGELKIFEDFMIPALGADAAVNAWRGPMGAPQDFQFAEVATEVKTRAARSPAVVKISGEQQLHDQPWAHLFLAHLAVDEQEAAGETLPERIASVRRLLAYGASAELFEDALLEAGWLEADSDQHTSRGFILRTLEFFEIKGDFPRLTPNRLPDGIGGLSYSLSIDAAEPFKVSEEDVKTALPGG